MDPTIQCRFPELGAMVGLRGDDNDQGERATGTRDSSAGRLGGDGQVPKPWVVVIDDLDYPRPVGSYWGEVNGSVYKALGAVGPSPTAASAICPEVRATGFHFFSSCVLVSHAYVHVVEAGNPVTVGGLTVHPGDLLHGDEHGVTEHPARNRARAARGGAGAWRRESEADRLRAIGAIHARRGWRRALPPGGLRTFDVAALLRPPHARR